MRRLPVAVVIYFSAIRQGRVAAAAMLMTGKRPEMSGKGITMTVMVETYAITISAGFLPGCECHQAVRKARLA